MALDCKKYPFLYSTGTQLAYDVEKQFYGDCHYVWCTTCFNDVTQPPTSRPLEICRRYLEIIVTGDCHAHEININKSGVLRGAKVKLDSKIIEKNNYYTIRGILSKSRFEAFCPVVYIIHSEKVMGRCIEVPSPYRANNKSVEYRIEDLHPNEYQAIFLKDVLNGVINIVDKEVENVNEQIKKQKGT